VISRPGSLPAESAWPISVIRALALPRPTSDPGRHDGHRSGHPGNRAVREDRWPDQGVTAAGTVASEIGHSAAAQRCRAGDPGDDAGDAGIHVRGPVAAPRSCPSAGETERAGSQLFKPLRQVIESINETFKGQLDLERH